MAGVDSCCFREGWSKEAIHSWEQKEERSNVKTKERSGQKVRAPCNGRGWQSLGLKQARGRKHLEKEEPWGAATPLGLCHMIFNVCNFNHTSYSKQKVVKSVYVLLHPLTPTPRNKNENNPKPWLPCAWKGEDVAEMQRTKENSYFLNTQEHSSWSFKGRFMNHLRPIRSKGCERGFVKNGFKFWALNTGTRKTP